MRTSELTGAALDWAVAKCEGYESGCGGVIPYSTDWAQAGPIIEREKIYVKPTTRLVKGWRTYQLDETGGGICNSQYGPTPLVAAMRCYVASRLGEFVYIPEELT